MVGSQFTVALGDNFYYDGVTDVHDPRFKETFEDVFTAQSLQNRWYVIAGNHDHYGNVTAQVAYTDISKRWYMPSLYYTETIPIPGTQDSVQFVYIDTIVLAGLSDPVKRHIQPKGPASIKEADDELAWIENTLSQSKAKWLFVLGHYPVWSIGEHGPTDVLVKSLEPLLEKYKVNAYFCGHDHSMQHLKPVDSSVDYFVIGAGHLTDHSTAHKDSVPHGSLRYWYAPEDMLSTHGAFATVTVSDHVNVTYIDYKGQYMYSAVNTNPRQM